MSDLARRWLVLAAITTLGTALATTALANEPEVESLANMTKSIAANGAARYVDASELRGRSDLQRLRITARAKRVMEHYAADFGLSNLADTLEALGARRDQAENTHVRLGQHHAGIPVEGAQVVVHFDRNGDPTCVTGEVVPSPSVGVTPSIRGATAARVALQEVARETSVDLSAQRVRLVIFNDGLASGAGGRNHLAFKVTVVGTGVREFVFVSGTDGSVVGRFTGIQDARDRQTYDMNGGTNYNTATLERSEGDPATGDADVDDAHDFAGDTYDFFANAYERDSIDDAGFPLRSYTHYGGSICPNAFWDGTRMTYCNGFPTDDVTAHEITHGVTEFTANLVYQSQPGALNESYSDIFGEAVDQLNGAGTDTEAVKWEVGEDLEVFGVIRDMSNPPAFGDPDRVGSPLYYCGFADSQGVHTNSGVPNKNFYLLADGGSFNGRSVQGLGLTKASAIHYQALSNYLGVNSQFQNHFIALWQSCKDLVGVNLNDPVTGLPSGEILTQRQCFNVLRAGLAVEFLQTACP